MQTTEKALWHLPTASKKHVNALNFLVTYLYLEKITLIKFMTNSHVKLLKFSCISALAKNNTKRQKNPMK